MTDQDELMEQFEVLKSIYPELTISETNDLSIEIELKPTNNVLFQHVSNSGKVLHEFKSKHLEPLAFKTKTPIALDNFTFESNWINPQIFDKFKQDISLILQDLGDDSLYAIFDYLMTDLLPKYEFEIFDDFIITTESQITYQKYQDLCSKARIWNFEKSTFSCSICLETKDSGKEDGLLLDCDHSFCKSCLLQYATNIINFGDVSKLQCPNCPIILHGNLNTKSSLEVKDILFQQKLSNETLSAFLTEDLFSKYQTLFNTITFEKYQQVFPFSCSKCPRCSNWIFRDDVDDKLVQCHGCQFAYCFDCNHSWHGTNNPCGLKLNTIPTDIIETLLNGTCSESLKRRYQSMYGKHTLDLAIDEYLADLSFKETVDNGDDMIRCPSCSTVITKSDGCNKMKCFVCTENFCYLCGKALQRDNPYTHFNDIFSQCYGRLFEGIPGTDIVEE